MLTPPTDSQAPARPASFLSQIREQPGLLAAMFLIAYLFAVSLFYYVHTVHAEQRRVETRMLAQGYAQRIQERLVSSLVSTHVLGSIVKQSGGQVENFDDIAAELLVLFPGVSALQLAPDGVIREIYPLAGNEAAVGHDLLSDRKRNREAAAAITTRQLTLAGPFPLIQGGMGAVGRLPVFISDERGDSHFWGFVTALVRIPGLLESAGLDGLEKSGYRYELWRAHPDTDQRDIIARNSERPLVDPVEYVVTISGSRWILSISPLEGWISAYDYFEIFGLSFAGALALALIQFWAMWAAARRR